jgi:hypothetical protein
MNGGFTRWKWNEGINLKLKTQNLKLKPGTRNKEPGTRNHERTQHSGRLGVIILYLYTFKEHEIKRKNTRKYEQNAATYMKVSCLKI